MTGGFWPFQSFATTPPPRDQRKGGQGLITDILSTEFEMEKDHSMSASASKKGTLKPHPTKDEIALLPAFEGLQLGQIFILESLDQFKDALTLIQAAGVVGFDTESKPVFTKEGESDGPHVVQIALNDRAYIVPIGTNPPIEFLTAVLGSKDIIKVGFGLKSDRAHLRRKFGVLLRGDIELTQPLRALGYRQRLGAKAAVAVVLGQNLNKSKSVTTSNWARRPLDKSQLLYAANDAFSALKIFRALGSPLQLTHTKTKVIQGPCAQ